MTNKTLQGTPGFLVGIAKETSDGAVSFDSSQNRTSAHS